MTIVFKAKTHCAYVMKIMIELLQNNIKTGCFEIDKNGIRLRMMDHGRTILINMLLDSDNFNVYKCKSDEKLIIGINLNHFHKMLKSIKKKDSMQLFIDDENPHDLGIKVIPKENNRITTSGITIQNIQTIDIELPGGYDKPVIVPSSEYHKMCKDMSQIGNVIGVVAHRFNIKFNCNDGGVMKRNVEFGDANDSDNDDENDCEIDCDDDDDCNDSLLDKDDDCDCDTDEDMDDEIEDEPEKLNDTDGIAD